MTAMFSDDVADLGELLGRDLGHWLDDPEDFAPEAASTEQPFFGFAAWRPVEFR